MFAPSLYYIYKFGISQINNCKLTVKKKNLDKFKIQQFDNQLFRIMRSVVNSDKRFISEIIFINTHGKKDELIPILKNGIMFNKVKYIYYGKNASMSRNGILAFVDEKYIKDIDAHAMMDIELDNVVLSKFEAYKHLIMSSCHFIEDYIPNIVIIRDFKKIVPNQNIKYVVDVEKSYKDKETGETKTYIEKAIQEGYQDIEICPADGSGIHTPEMGEFISSQIDIGTTPCLYQIRLPYTKGLSIQVDFKKYFKEHGITHITDYWGNSHAVEDIDAIWTDNMFKGVKYFKNWNTYIEKFKKYNHVFGISKWNFSNKEEAKYVQTNYQCLQTLEMPKEEFLKIADYSKQWVERILSGDLLYLFNFLGRDDDSCKYVKAIRKNHNMIKDPAVQTYVRGLLMGFMNDMKLGSIWIKGSYKFLIPDLEAFMQHAGGLKNVVGCLKAGEFHAKDLKGEHVLDRNPHIFKSEHAILNAVQNSFTKEYCKHFANVCMLNFHDITDKRLNGSDKDGDGVIVSDEKLLMSGVVRNLPIVIDVDDKITALEVKYTQENIINYVLMSITNDIGEISNVATCYLNKKTKDEKWKKTYEDNVCLLSVINGKSIDFAKTGIKWSIPYKVAKKSKPLPYFMKYKYRKLKKTNNASSNMNCLAWNIEQWQRTLYNIETTNMFDLMYNAYLPFDKKKFEKILSLYKQFTSEYGELKSQDRIIRNTSHANFQNMYDDLSVWEIENTKIDFKGLYEKFKKSAMDICNSDIELANYAVKIVYEMYPNKDKTFAWTVAEEGLIKNLKPDMKMYNIRITNPREGVEYLGKWYKLEEII